MYDLSQTPGSAIHSEGHPQSVNIDEKRDEHRKALQVCLVLFGHDEK